MAKTKKGRDESSESEESTASSSSSESSSSESSSTGEEASKKRKAKKLKKVKTKKRRKEKSSSSSSSSSEDSNDDSSSSSEDEKSKKKKEKDKKPKDKKEAAAESSRHPGHSKERRPVHSSRPEEERPLRREVSDLQNRSKWDSPSNEVDEGRYERYRERDRNYYDWRGRGNGGRRGRRYEDNNRRYENRDRNYWDRDRRQERNREVYNDRNRDRDQKPYRGRDNNYNERRNNNREDRDRRDDRENRRSRSPRRPRNFPRRRSGDDNNYEWGGKRDYNDDKESKQPEDKEKPNFGLSGKLTEDANKVNGVVIKYAEPLEARKPKRRWRLYPFKGEKALPTLYIHRQSCYLIGRDRKVCDLPVDHPSCSKQHAALQYRLVPFDRDDGTVGKRVRPYIIDLESANGTFINNKKTDSKKYIELLEKDVIKFGFSSREYVLLHENSKEDQQDDDITEEVQVKEEPAD